LRRCDSETHDGIVPAPDDLAEGAPRKKLDDDVKSEALVRGLSAAAAKSRSRRPKRIVIGQRSAAIFIYDIFT
jgi:hypothetical protein